jgi:hypothetical protein
LAKEIGDRQLVTKSGVAKVKVSMLETSGVGVGVGAGAGELTETVKIGACHPAQNPLSIPETN